MNRDVFEWALSIDLTDELLPEDQADIESADRPSDQIRVRLESVAAWLFRSATVIDAGVKKINQEIDLFNESVGRYQMLVVNLIFLYGAVVIFLHLL